MPDPPPSETPEAPETPTGIDLWLTPFFKDSTLWPVTAVAIAIFLLFGAWALLLTFTERNVFAAVALVALFWMSVDVVVRHRARLSPLLVACILGFWVGSIALAFGVSRAGWF